MMEDANDIKLALDSIWDNESFKCLRDSVLWQRRFWFPVNDLPSDLLITGINPSYRPDEDDPKPIRTNFLLSDKAYDTYWTPLRRILYEDRPERRTAGNPDFRDRTSVLDLFYFREKDQKYLRNVILKKWPASEAIPFLVSQLQLTQKRIESIKPRLIIVKNEESQAYWGKLDSPAKECIWMGYKFEDVTYRNGRWTLSRIVGINPGNISGIQSSELVKRNTLVLFVPHINQYTRVEDRPTPEVVKELLDIQARF